MAKKGIKVRDLARELSVTPRNLIDRCRRSGMAVQNGITKLSPDQVHSIRAWFSDPSPGDDMPTHAD